MRDSPPQTEIMAMSGERRKKVIIRRDHPITRKGPILRKELPTIRITEIPARKTTAGTAKEE
jgi:hypothetical protein